MKYSFFIVLFWGIAFYSSTVYGGDTSVSVSSTVAMPVGLETPPDTFADDIESAGASIREAMQKYKVKDKYLFYSMQGMKDLFNGRPDVAVSLFSEAIKMQPDFAEAYEDRALALEQTGDYSKALSDYNSLIALDPANKNFYLGKKGGAHMALQQYSEAVKCFDEALKANPKDAIVMRNKSLALSSIGKYTEAGALYQKAVDLNPSLKLPADVLFCEGLKKNNVETAACGR